MTRLQRFRAFLTRMNPSGDPRDALHGDLCVLPELDIGDDLRRSLELDPVGTHLVLGGIGSGKSTEVLRAVRALSNPLGEIGDFVEYIDVSTHTHLDTTTQSGVILALAGRALIHALPKSDHAQLAPALNTLRRFSEGHYEWVPDFLAEPDHDDRPDDDEPDDAGEYVHVPGVLHPVARATLPRQLHAPTGALRRVRNVHPGSERFVVLAFDALDRLPQPEHFVQIVRDDIRALKQCQIGAIVVGPIRYMVGADRGIGELFDYTHYKRSIDPQEPTGLDFLVRILRHRAGDLGLLSENCIIPLAQASGGVLRDLITVAKRAAEDAYTTGSEQILEEHVFRARDALGRGLAVGLDDEQLTALRKVYETKGFVVRGARELTLLETRRVLMYESRWVVHPALAPLLGLMPEVP